MSSQVINHECKLMELSDCLMITLLSHLDATSLYHLSRTCLYFNNIIKDKQLWLLIDARREPNNYEKIDYVCNRVHEKTRHLLLQGHGKRTKIHPSLPSCLSQNITVLALEQQKIDGSCVNMRTLPSSLVELSLKKSIVKNSISFFRYSSSNMANLRVLILNECNWLKSTFLMFTAKYPSLEILSIINCHQLQVNLTPYFSVARTGFDKIKVIDCRFTAMSHDFLRGFMLKKSLVSLYFQSMLSYQLDTGVPLFPKIWEKTRKLTSYKIEEIQRLSISNSSLYEFKDHRSSGLVEEMPKSLLYNFPYKQCSCKFEKLNQEVISEQNGPDLMEIEIDDYISYDGESQRFICKRHLVQVQSLPEYDYIRELFGRDQNISDSDSSDSDSNSDDESSACCVFSRNHGTKMIVMKINGNGTIDDEIIDIRPPPPPTVSSPDVISLQLQISLNSNENTSSSRSITTTSSIRPNNIDNSQNVPGLSTHGSSPNCRQKRKNEGGTSEEPSSKKLKTEKNTLASNRISTSSNDNPEPSTSRGNNKLEETDEKRESRSSSEEPRPSTSDNTVREQRITIHHIFEPNHRLNVRFRPNLRRRDPEGDNSESDADNEPFDYQRAIAVPEQYLNAQVVLRPLPIVHVPNRHVQAKNVNELKKLNLRQLSVRGYRRIDDKALEYMKNLNLNLLDVTHTSVTKEGIEKFLDYNPNCRVVHKDFCVCKPSIPS